MAFPFPRPSLPPFYIERRGGKKKRRLTSQPRVLHSKIAVKQYAYIAIRQWCENRPSPCKTVEEAVQWA